MHLQDMNSETVRAWETERSVSYTHLDVYKRQQQPSYIIKQSPPDSNILLFVGKIVNCNEEN